MKILQKTFVTKKNNLPGGLLRLRYKYTPHAIANSKVKMKSDEMGGSEEGWTSVPRDARD